MNPLFDTAELCNTATLAMPFDGLYGIASVVFTKLVPSTLKKSGFASAFNARIRLCLDVTCTT